MLRMAATFTLAAGIAAGCASAPKPPAAKVADACDLLSDNKDWYKAMRKSAREWGAPMGYQLAVVRQESGFDRKARPPREKGFLGLVPGKRPSDAYGYAQALEGTWESYKDQTGRGGADRDDFKDAVHFIGWYFSTTGEKTGIGQYDFRNHYLAYHEGVGGFQRGSWRSKGWLVDVANRVSATATTYEKQIRACPDLKSKFLGVF